LGGDLGCRCCCSRREVHFLGAAALLLISLILAWPLSINFTRALNFDPSTIANVSPKLIYTPQPDEGPVSIALEFRVVSGRRQEFVSLMREARLIFLRNGAHNWGLREDLTRSDAYGTHTIQADAGEFRRESFQEGVVRSLVSNAKG
jgi:hypothetical protein